MLYRFPEFRILELLLRSPRRRDDLLLILLYLRYYRDIVRPVV